jgi:hypothetical protein
MIVLIVFSFIAALIIALTNQKAHGVDTIGRLAPPNELRWLPHLQAALPNLLGKLGYSPSKGVALKHELDSGML